MGHGQAWLIAGRDIMWFGLAVSPIGLLGSPHPDAVPTGIILYVVVMVLCYCAGAGYI